MMRLTRLALVVCILPVAVFGAEQNEKPPLPRPPLIKRAPDVAEWTIAFVEAPAAKPVNPSGSPAQSADHSDAAKKAPPHAITVTKTGKTFHEVEVDSDGKRWEKWNVNGKQITFWPESDKWILVDSGAFTKTFTNYGRHDFPDILWIAEKNYSGVADVFGKKCYVFHDRVSFPEIKEPLDVTAGIDIETLLPVYLNIDGVARRYTFSAPPPSPISAPQTVQQILAKVQKAVEPLTKRPQ